jgi:hypothetical protein
MDLRQTASVVRLPGCRLRGLGLDGVHSALVRISEELLERKAAAPV